jgi:hypothetical protein
MRTVFATALFLAGAALPLRAGEGVFGCFFDWACNPDTARFEGTSEDFRFMADLETHAVPHLGGDPLIQASLILGGRAVTILEMPVSGGTAAAATIRISNGEAVRSDHRIPGNTPGPRQLPGERITF